MAHIEGIRIQNYKALKDITLGHLWNNHESPLSDLTVVIGRNGVGKSSIFDAFGFISDCLKNGIEEACDVRGGFSKIISKGCFSDAYISFELYYKENNHEQPITYEFSINLDSRMRPYVVSERLRQRRKGQKKIRKTFFFSHFK